jgi:hypothetical protein
MRWRNARRSANPEDRRGRGSGGFSFGGGGRGGRRLTIGGGLGGLAILILFVVLGGDPMALLQQMDSPGNGVGTRSVLQIDISGTGAALQIEG